MINSGLVPHGDTLTVPARYRDGSRSRRRGCSRCGAADFGFGPASPLACPAAGAEGIYPKGMQSLQEHNYCFSCCRVKLVHIDGQFLCSGCTGLGRLQIRPSPDAYIHDLSCCMVRFGPCNPIPIINRVEGGSVKWKYPFLTIGNLCTVANDIREWEDYRQQETRHPV